MKSEPLICIPEVVYTPHDDNAIKGRKINHTSLRPALLAATALLAFSTAANNDVFISSADKKYEPKAFLQKKTIKQHSQPTYKIVKNGKTIHLTEWQEGTFVDIDKEKELKNGMVSSAVHIMAALAVIGYLLTTFINKQKQVIDNLTNENKALSNKLKSLEHTEKQEH